VLLDPELHAVGFAVDDRRDVVDVGLRRFGHLLVDLEGVAFALLGRADVAVCGPVAGRHFSAIWWHAVPQSAASEVVSGRPSVRASAPGQFHRRSVELADQVACERSLCWSAILSDHRHAGPIARRPAIDRSAVHADLQKAVAVDAKRSVVKWLREPFDINDHDFVAGQAATFGVRLNPFLSSIDFTSI
jgi:hypothetical protein